jgi:predicted hotdog family 3-hydroxylacyl-ACP dehydratase
MSALKSPAPIDFADLIPHAGAMSLIDRVECWSSTEILCGTASHHNPVNPLRFGNHFSSLHLLEYGAQAAAIHGGLLTGKAMPGLFAAARSAYFYIDDLTTVETELLIKAKVELFTARGAIYAITVTDSNQRLLCKARAMVVNL